VPKERVLAAKTERNEAIQHTKSKLQEKWVNKRLENY
jgi:hypothetical protein